MHLGWVEADMAHKYVGASYEQVLRQGKIGNLAAVRSLCRDCTIRVESVRNRSVGYEPPRPFLFYTFLFSALTHQIVFSTIAGYIVLKTLFFFGFLSSALLGNERLGVRLTPDLTDRADHRFGLGSLDNVYCAVLILLALASVGASLQALRPAATQSEKGTYFLRGREVLPLIGQPLVLLSTVIVFGTLVLTPVILFMLLTIRVVNQELARLRDAQKALEAAWEGTSVAGDRERIEMEMKVVEGRRKAIAMQSLLPAKKPVFQALLAANVVFLLILPPVVTKTRGGAGAVRFAGEFLCVLSWKPDARRVTCQDLLAIPGW